ncbi:MAG: ribonuclease D [Rickettsiales bacterium]|nr:ribonuclease D [Pseudomonadota bacterium]MDA0966364.1 ribonuclease D [Pseudomonadota bacterium]MDG4543997.1 ribonuclease D [Rickettsiales bacterium]MDG4545491.1 ribonuclease D [Rickettsiales bacterium]MDG4547940.1 ribonuclease D [Rickettsiales bacterium]
MKLVTDTNELKELCKELSNNEYITVDTEFLRERTYYPKLCLVQVASDDIDFAIDPLSENMDLSPLFEIFCNKSILKVFHSARQDIEIILNLSGKIPEPLFDTQVAAMVCGFGASVSYATLVSELAKANTDKSSRFTDWSRRPLTDKQLQYALSDVTHLRTIYQKLKIQLESSGRAKWLEEEMETLTNPNTYSTSPEYAWKKLKPRGTSRRFLGVLKELAAWREIKAMELDKPRGHIVKDQSLLEIAAVCPKDTVQLTKIRSVGNLKKSHEMEIIEAIERGNNIPEADLPKLSKLKSSQKADGSTIELLKVLLKAQCEKFHVAEKIVATTDDLKEIATDNELPALLSKGWRYEVFGKYALSLKNGESYLNIKDGKINVGSTK